MGVEAMNMAWEKGQQIDFSVNLAEAAKQHLQFLAAVDATTGSLYDGQALERAINRYKYCWLPLLAKHMECSVVEGPLVVPLDCEWIWHCHRLNPLRYKRDCEEIFGRILDKINVSSTVGGVCSKQTESIWNKIYVSEPFHLDLDNALPESFAYGDDVRSTEYDLVAAVKRQSSFFSKISKVIGYDDGFLHLAVARYKSFLHLSKMLMERNKDFPFVPTHDIDLIWHTHQLYPCSYTTDLTKIFGKVLDHNDRDTESTDNGTNYLHIMFMRTKQVWEKTYNFMYCLPEATYKNSRARCSIDHVPGLGLGQDKSAVVSCFKTCSMTEDGSMDHVPGLGQDKSAVAGCFKTCSMADIGPMDHVPDLGQDMSAVASCFKTCSMADGENRAQGYDGSAVGKCFKTCSMSTDDANRARCIVNCYMSVEGTKQAQDAAARCIVNCYMGVEGTN